MFLSLTTFLLAINFFGHTIVLYFVGLFTPKDSNSSAPSENAKINFIIPIYNEAEFLEEKIENTNNLIKSSRHKIQAYFVDGNSTDNSLAILKSKGYSWLNILVSPDKGKIPQINYALNHIKKAEYTFISDADSILTHSDAFEKAINYLQKKNTGLVGAWTIPNPQTALGVEQAYWDKQNRFRYLETRKCTSSIVTAQFYGFKSSFLSSFPVDCIADDVYVSLLCHKNRQKIIYAFDIEAVELRQAKTLFQLFFQKLRKANAYTKELLRFYPVIKEAENMQKYTILFKYYQFIILPWVSLLYLFIVFQHFIFGSTITAALSIFILFASTLFASILITPPPSKKRGGFRIVSIVHTLIVFSMVNLILLLNGLIFYSWHPNSQYKRVT